MEGQDALAVPSARRRSDPRRTRRARRGTDGRGQDARRRVRDRRRGETRSTDDLHGADQGAVEPEVPRLPRRRHRRRAHDGRRDDPSGRASARDDDGDPAQLDLREPSSARAGRVRRVRRSPLHGRRRARIRVGGVAHLRAEGRALRVPLRDDPERRGTRRLALRDPRPRDGRDRVDEAARSARSPFLDRAIGSVRGFGARPRAQA